jgi:dihydrofolate reductase
VAKVVVYTLLSLDGVASEEEIFDGWDDALDAEMASVISTQDAVILGRRTWDGWARFWPTSDFEPFATFINDVPKFVATSSSLDQDWPGSTKIEGELIDFVRGRRDEKGGDVGVHGSISVAQALLAAGVVDELKLIVRPLNAGRGRRLLDGLPTSHFRLQRSTVSPTGYLFLDYRVVP